LFKKGLTVGIILLFILSSLIPITSSYSSFETNKAYTVHIDENGTLSGYVKDTSMNPIKGARVRVYFHETYEENYTDSSGYYNVTNIPICGCLKNATASKEGYTTEWVLLAIDENTNLDFVLIPLGKTLYVGGSGAGNYTTIQSAIDNASAGDTVYVYSGTYFEDVKVNTSIVLQGEDKESTIIHGGGFGSGDGVIFVSADNVEITGFSVRNSCTQWPGSGIGLYSTKQCIVTDNIVYDCFIGIHAFVTSDVTISKNTVTDSEFGIRVQASERNTITRNTMQDNYRGMELNGAYFNKIMENNFIRFSLVYHFFLFHCLGLL